MTRERPSWAGSVKTEVRKEIHQLLLAEICECSNAIVAGPVCSSLSVASTPPVRSSAFPEKLPESRASMTNKVAEGSSAPAQS